MSKTNINEERFVDALGRAIQGVVREIVEEEAEKAAEEAAKRVRQRVAEKADSIALKLLSDYDIQRDARRIIISVRKTGEGITL